MRVEKIIGKSLISYELDVNNYDAIDSVFKKHMFYAVLHLAAFKSVGESVSKPLKYYGNNVGGTVNVLKVCLAVRIFARSLCNVFDNVLLKVMQDNNVFNFVFSSSATVYGTPRYLPLDENHSVIGYEVTNPYGKTKYMVEHVLHDLCKSDSVIKHFLQ